MDEIKDRYKNIPLWQRLIVLAILALLPAVYVWWTDGEEIRAEMQTMQSEMNTAKGKFEEARDKRSRLPELEETLAFTREQLEVARKSLPDKFNVDEVLQKTAAVAREVGVEMSLFEPQDEQSGQDGSQFRELPIRTTISGRFSQVVAFLDRITHMETLIFARNIDMVGSLLQEEGEDGEDGAAPPNGAAEETEIGRLEQARENRENMRVEATFEMILFRTPNV